MNGELAQAITLVAHGNLFLHSPEKTRAPDLLATNSAFQFVSSFRFARYADKNDTQGVDVAANVADWFAFLREVGTTRLWNVAFDWPPQSLPEHVSVAFAGAVDRAIQADLPASYELWYPLWEVGESQEKPWFVEYRSLMFDESHAVTVDLADARERLRQALQQVEAFARHPGVDEPRWAELFADSLRSLDGRDAATPVLGDMLPERGFSREARCLLSAAAQADVFGGMGSWNDLGFSDDQLQSEYERVSAELYEAVKLATVIAPNAFSPSEL